jgi:hypothetical protein
MMLVFRMQVQRGCDGGMLPPTREPRVQAVVKAA